MASVLWGQNTTSTDVDTAAKQALALSVPDDAPNAGAPYGSIFEGNHVGSVGPVGPGDVGGYPENDRDPYTGPVDAKSLESGPDNPLFDVSFSRMMQDPEVFLKFEKDQQEKARETQWRNTVAFFGGNVELARDATTGIEPVYPELWFLGGNPVSPLVDLAGAGVKSTARAASKVFAVNAARAAGSMVKKDVAALASSVSKALPRGADRVVTVNGRMVPWGSAGYVDTGTLLQPLVKDGGLVSRTRKTVVRMMSKPDVDDTALTLFQDVVPKIEEQVPRVTAATDAVKAAVDRVAQAREALAEARGLQAEASSGLVDAQVARAQFDAAVYSAPGQVRPTSVRAMYADKAVQQAQEELLQAEAAARARLTVAEDAYVDAVGSQIPSDYVKAVEAIPPPRTYTRGGAVRVPKKEVARVSGAEQAAAHQMAEAEAQAGVQLDTARSGVATDLARARDTRDVVVATRRQAVADAETKAAAEETKAGQIYSEAESSYSQAAHKASDARVDRQFEEGRLFKIKEDYRRARDAGRADGIFQPNEQIWEPALKFYRFLGRKVFKKSNAFSDARFDRAVTNMRPLIRDYYPPAAAGGPGGFSRALGRLGRMTWVLSGNNSAYRGWSMALRGLFRTVSPWKANTLNPIGRFLHYVTSPNMPAASLGSVVTAVGGVAAARKVGQMLGLVRADKGVDSRHGDTADKARPMAPSATPTDTPVQLSAVDRQVDRTGLQQIRADYRRTGDKAAFEAALNRLPDQVRTELLDEARNLAFAKYYPHTRGYEHAKSNPKNQPYIEAFDRAFDEVGLSGWAAWDGRAPVPQLERALRRR